MKHKKTQLFSMECEEDMNDSDEDDLDMEEEREGSDKEHISINAITGISDYTTMVYR